MSEADALPNDESATRWNRKKGFWFWTDWSGRQPKSGFFASLNPPVPMHSRVGRYALIFIGCYKREKKREGVGTV